MRTRLRQMARRLVLALAVLMLGFLVGTGAAALFGKTGIPQEDVIRPANDTASTTTPPSDQPTFTSWNRATSPNYYRVVGKAVVDDAPEAGTVSYGPMDQLGRATGATALITKASMDEGRARQRDDMSSLTPSGWGYNQEVDIALPDGSLYHGLLFNRSHLVAKSLGGDDELHNLICGTRTQNVGANLDGSEGGMAYCEGIARAWLASNPEGTLYYRATPLYADDELVARSVMVDMHSSDGSIDQRVEVYNAAWGFDIDYATGSFVVSAPAAELAAKLTGIVPSGEPSATDDSDHAEPVASPAPTAVTEATGTASDAARLVVVTKSGKAYHHDETCSGLAHAHSMQWVSVEEAEAMGRHPCGICGG